MEVNNSKLSFSEKSLLFWPMNAIRYILRKNFCSAYSTIMLMVSLKLYESFNGSWKLVKFWNIIAFIFRNTICFAFYFSVPTINVGSISMLFSSWIYSNYLMFALLWIGFFYFYCSHIFLLNTCHFLFSYFLLACCFILFLNTLGRDLLHCFPFIPYKQRYFE